MVEFPLGYREVVPDQTLPEKWKEITLNTGKRVLTSDQNASTARQTEISIATSLKNASGNCSRRRESTTLAE